MGWVHEIRNNFNRTFNKQGLNELLIGFIKAEGGFINEKKLLCGADLDFALIFLKPGETRVLFSCNPEKPATRVFKGPGNLQALVQ